MARVTDIETGSALYARLKDAYFNHGTRELPPEAVEQWNADQETGRLEIACVDGAKVQASYEILGTHDGHDFRWADQNPSVLKSDAATRARGLLKAAGAEALAGPDKLPLGLRDVTALLSMAAEALGVENTFLGRSRRVAAAMVLSDIAMTPARRPTESEPASKGLLRRLFGARKTVRADAELDSPLGMLHQMKRMIEAQVDANALAPEALVAFDAICADADADYLAGRFDAALSKIAEGKRQLGEFFIDQEPAGRLLYCEGACLLAKGEREGAHRAFGEAGRAIVPPSAELLRLAKARSAPTESSRRSYLCGLYLGSPAWFAEQVTEEEAAIVRFAQAEADAARASVADDAEVVLRAAIAARFAQEKRAYALADEASRHRKQQHILCDHDEVARATIDAEHRSLLLTWFDVPRNPSMGSWSMRPDEDPAALLTLTATERGSEAALFEATYSTPHTSAHKYRYRLLRGATPMSTRSLWRMTEVWSVWPDEDIRVL